MSSKITKDNCWQELPMGGLLPEGGTAKEYYTGGWRSQRPVWIKEKCINCYACWINCPDSSILMENGRVVGIDYDHCKGCGICAHECPSNVQAIVMEKEGK
ncbi:MAG: 4Fe-4S binding protein [bacterium]